MLIDTLKQTHRLLLDLSLLVLPGTISEKKKTIYN